MPGLTASNLSPVNSQWSLINRIEKGALEAVIKNKLYYLSSQNQQLWVTRSEDFIFWLILKIFEIHWYLQQTVAPFFSVPVNVIVRSINCLPQSLSGTAFIMAVFLTAPGIVRQSYPEVLSPAVPYWQHRVGYIWNKKKII